MESLESIKSARPGFGVIVLLAFLLLAPLCWSLPAAAAGQAQLADQPWLLWQRFNQARSNPLAEVVRLGLNEAQVRAHLGADAWILDQGLPPLAWQANLREASLAHGRDMLTRVYYSHYSPEGTDPWARIAATGYQAVSTGEALGALIFGNPVPLDEAVNALIDNLLLEELVGNGSEPRRLLAPEFSELGLALLAESVNFAGSQPHVVLLVAAFAQPASPRGYLVGVAPAAGRLLVRNLYTGVWDLVAIQAGGIFQYPLSGRGEELLFQAGQGPYGSVVSSLGLDPGRNWPVTLSPP